MGYLATARPRTSIGFTPNQVPGLKLWLRGDIVSGDTWLDQSGNGNDFTGVNGLQVTNVLNGHSVIRTANHTTQITSSYNIDDSKPTMLYVVAKPADFAWNVLLGTASLCFEHAWSGNANTEFRSWTTNGNFHDFTGLTDYTSAFFVYTLTINETTGANGVTNLRQSGVSKGNSASRARSSCGSIIISDCRGVSQGFKGDIAALLIYEADTAHDAITQMKIEKSLAREFALAF